MFTALGTTEVAGQPPTIPALVRSDWLGEHRREVVWKDSRTIFVYTKPPPFHAATDVPMALAASVNDAFRADHIPALIGIAGLTIGLIASDESSLHETRRFARRVGLAPTHPSVDLRAGPFKLEFPTTIASGLYFLGDGLTSAAVAVGLAAHGSLRDDVRSRRVASEVIEALLASGVVTQLGKHAAGRQTPSEATVARGRWRPFAPLDDYNRNVPGYDAFPSGHLASTAATVTVLALNYPEHRFIRPLGYTAMGLLSFAMVNNGVHWASDYPVALAIGATVGKVVVERGRRTVHLPSRPETVGRSIRRAEGIDVVPILEPGAIGFRVRF